ncbi:MAG: hypothetical protein M1816_000899 [Peltula sp. TS41687]|nr:MAG: hypothetical protein M1816_000899 [Peltula sp. TS41687]
MSGHNISPLQRTSQTTETYAGPSPARINDNKNTVRTSRFSEQGLVEEPPQVAHFQPSQARKETLQRSISSSSTRPQLVEVWPQRPHPRRSGTFPLQRGDPGAIGAAISRPVAGLQWPRRDRGGRSTHRLNNSPTKEAFRIGKGPSPLSPLRLSHVPSLEAPFPAQSLGTSNRELQTQGYWEDSSQSTPDASSPLPTPGPYRISSYYNPLGPSSRQSTTSSVGTIPDFPNPGFNPPRRSSNLVPFALRRGVSSYYSRYSTVAPIPEESPELQWTHGSFASSRVIPSSWGSGPPEQITSPTLDQGAESEDYIVDDIIDSLTSASEDDTDVLDKDWEHQYGASLVVNGGKDAATTGLVATGGDITIFPAVSPEMRSPSTYSKSFASEESLAKKPLILNAGATSPTMSVQSRSPTVSSYDPAAYKINGSRKGTSPVQAFVLGNRPLMNGSARGQSSAPGRPLRSNANNMKEPEVRSSLTSLPDLIKRATRLASVLDRGRPASRMELSQSPVHTGKQGGDRIARNRDGALSQSSYRFPRSPASNPLGISLESKEVKMEYPKRRKCGGLPLHTFIILLILAIALIVAAVVLPILFVVLPRRHNASASATAGGCPKDFQCSNGGLKVSDVNSCRCVCVKGYTGDKCTIAPANECITRDFKNESGEMQSVTIGSSIPPLLEAGPTRFGVPLHVSAILSIFSQGNLSCNSENALVTFDGTSPSAQRELSPPAPAAGTPSRRRDLLIASGSPSTLPNPTVLPPATTVNGLVFATSPTPTPKLDMMPAAAASTTYQVDSEAIEFAKVGVLYVLQQSSLDKAVMAQQRLQSFFSTLQTSPNVNLGNGFGLDLQKRTFLFVNGTIVGGSNGVAP